MHFYSSAWQYPLYFMADSNRNCPHAVGCGLEDSEPLALVSLLLPGNQSIIFREMYRCKCFTGVPKAQLTDKTALCQALWETPEHAIRRHCITQGKEGFSQTFFSPDTCDHTSEQFKWVFVHVSVHPCALVLPAPAYSLAQGTANCHFRCYRSVWWCKRWITQWFVVARPFGEGAGFSGFLLSAMERGVALPGSRPERVVLGCCSELVAEREAGWKISCPRPEG